MIVSTLACDRSCSLFDGSFCPLFDKILDRVRECIGGEDVELLGLEVGLHEVSHAELSSSLAGHQSVIVLRPSTAEETNSQLQPARETRTAREKTMAG